MPSTLPHGGKNLWDAGHADMILEADRLAAQQSAILSADGALPEPGLVAVLGQRRAIAGAALGKLPRRGGLVGARLHEGVQFAHGIADERQVELGITAAQMKVERGGEFDQLDCIGHCEHGVPLGAGLRPRGIGQALTSISARRSSQPQLIPGKLFQFPRDPIASTVVELPDGTIVHRKERTAEPASLTMKERCNEYCRRPAKPRHREPHSRT
jgi:hypothetical protein